jgi:ABC-type Fe3+ transport system permease subunit
MLDRLLLGRRSVSMRGQGGRAWIILGLVLLLPLLLAVWVDRGPAGEVRFSLFPMALLALDPFARTCARNSVFFAGGVSVASLFLGVVLGWAMASRTYWGRPILCVAVASLLVVSPTFLALGILGLLGAPRAWPWPFSNSITNAQGPSLESWSGLPVWMIWLWTVLPAGVAAVSLATVSAVRRIEPSWGDAARLAGAGPIKTWRAFYWPLIRPQAVRSAAWVFALALLEPGVPLVMGLRRTLAFQIVESARRPAPFPRVAAWSVLAALFALGGWILIRWSGGPLVIGNRLKKNGSPAVKSDRRPASWWGALCACLLLAGWAAIGWLPLLGLFRIVLDAGWHANSSESVPIGPLSALLQRLKEPPVPTLLTNSALLGIEAACGIMLLGWLQSAGAGRREERGPRLRFFGPKVLAPPLIQGIAILSIPWLAELGALWLSGVRGGAAPSRLFLALASAIDPYRNAWPLLVISVVIVVAPALHSSWNAASRMIEARSFSALDAARVFGAPWLSRLRLLLARPRRALAGQFILAWALAATNLTPALLFVPWTEGMTISPGVLALAEGPGDARFQAAGLALCAVAINLAALAVARATSAIRDPQETEFA